MFFNTQIYDIEGNKLKNVLKTFGEIVYQFDYKKITGILSRNFPLFNPTTKEIFSIFFNSLFNENSQGVSLLKARQHCVLKKLGKIGEQSTDVPISINIPTKIDLRTSLAVSSFLLFGKPWKKLNS